MLMVESIYFLAFAFWRWLVTFDSNHPIRHRYVIMSPVSANSSGVADLLQTFSGTGASANSSVLSSTLASTQVQTALQNASPGDIVQLSEQAVQLQQVAGLFGSSEQAANAASNTVNRTG
jgi:hypothetical protein